MTERTEVRFNAYNNTSSSIFTAGGGRPIWYNIVDFNVGGGTYDTTGYTYTIPIEGTYLIGASYTKNHSRSTAQIMLKRNGVLSILSVARGADTSTQNTTLNMNTLYYFLKDDIVYVRLIYSGLKFNSVSVPAGNIYNSFWGIRLSY
jgi:transketolase